MNTSQCIILHFSSPNRFSEAYEFWLNFLKQLYLLENSDVISKRLQHDSTYNVIPDFKIKSESKWVMSVFVLWTTYSLNSGNTLLMAVLLVWNGRILITAKYHKPRRLLAFLILITTNLTQSFLQQYHRKDLKNK